MKWWCISAAIAAALGLVCLFTPVRFSGLLLLALAALLLVFGLLRRRKGARRILCALVALGCLVLAAAEVQVLRYGRTDTERVPGAVIILGAGVYGTRPSLSLSVRLQAALDYIADKPDLPIVVSGGQGEGEDITEAQCMADWLTARGVDPARILRDDEAANTRENIANSKALLREHGVDTTGDIAVVTADYHLYRASLYYELPYMIPVAASMPDRWWPITVNQYVREAFAVVYLWVFGT